MLPGVDGLRHVAAPEVAHITQQRPRGPVAGIEPDGFLERVDRLIGLPLPVQLLAPVRQDA